MTPRTRTSAAVLMLAAAAWLSTSATAGDLELTVDKLVLRVPESRGDKAPNHKLRLKAHFEPDASLDAFDVQTDDVRITIGGLEVFALPAADVRGAVKSKKALQWRYRGARRDGRPRLKLDLSLLSVDLRAKRLDLTALADGETSGVEVALHLGETVFCGTIDLGRKGKRLKLVPRTPDTQPPDAQPPDDPPGDARDGPLPLTDIDTGQYSATQRAENVVARTAAEWSALWARHGGRGAAPRVDFTSEMVLAVFLGQRPHPAHTVRIESATARGDDVDVAFAEVIRAGDVWPTVVTTPHAIVRVPRRTGRVAFTGRVVRSR